VFHMVWVGAARQGCRAASCLRGLSGTAWPPAQRGAPGPGHPYFPAFASGGAGSAGGPDMAEVDSVGMSTRIRRHLVLDLVGQIAFRHDEPGVRRKNARSLLLSIFLALLFSSAFGVALFFLSKQSTRL